MRKATTAATLLVLFLALPPSHPRAGGSWEDILADIARSLEANRYELRDGGSNGFRFLDGEAKKARFFFIGELHGSREVPELIRSLWPALVQDGYRHVAIELGPWTTSLLARYARFGDEKAIGLFNSFALPAQPWSRREIELIRFYGTTLGKNMPQAGPVIWGCDQEIQPDVIAKRIGARIREMHTRSATRLTLLVSEMLDAMPKGFEQSKSSHLLEKARQASVAFASLKGAMTRKAGVSAVGEIQRQLELLATTLEIFAAKQDNSARIVGQQLREELMKALFLEHYRAVKGIGTTRFGNPRSLNDSNAPKVLIRFGQSHGTRGYDLRNISTFANFLAELAICEKVGFFNVITFATGGKLALGGKQVDWDDRTGDKAVEFMSRYASFDVTIFDLRPLRLLLQIEAPGCDDPLLASLRYDANGYDAAIVYRQVTPLD